MLSVPSIHLNGTSGATLRREYIAAHNAVNDAYEALTQVTVHGRDYYVQGDGAFQKAREEHLVRLRKLSDVRDELAAIMEALHQNHQVKED